MAAKANSSSPAQRQVQAGAPKSKFISRVKSMKMKAVNRMLVGYLAVLGASLVMAQAQSFIVNFDTPGDLANNFNIYQNTSPAVVNAATGSPYSQSLTGGLGGSGSMSIATPARSEERRVGKES